MEIEVIVEIPKGTRKSTEADHDTGAIWLDRMLFTSTPLPRGLRISSRLTLAEDDGPSRRPGAARGADLPGLPHPGRPLGVFLMSDEKGQDAKVLCVPATDPRTSEVSELEHVPEHELAEDRPLLRYLQGARTRQGHRRRRLAGRAEAEAVIEAARVRYTGH